MRGVMEARFCEPPLEPCCDDREPQGHPEQTAHTIVEGDNACPCSSHHSCSTLNGAEPGGDHGVSLSRITLQERVLEQGVISTGLQRKPESSNYLAQDNPPKAL